MEQEVVVPGHKEELSKLITSIDSYCSDTELLHIHWVVRVVQPPCIRGLQENYLEYSRAAESKTGKHARYKRCCRFKVFFFKLIIQHLFLVNLLTKFHVFLQFPSVFFGQFVARSEIKNSQIYSQELDQKN